MTMSSSVAFLLTRPLRDVTIFQRRRFVIFNISTHTSLAGRDKKRLVYERYGIISTHTSLAGRDGSVERRIRKDAISTHTSLAGRDCLCTRSQALQTISTHTSLAGRDKWQKFITSGRTKFLLTRPLRDVTKIFDMRKTRKINFYSHVPCGT